MSANGVNLDALIPREDMIVGDGLQSGSRGEDKLGISHFTERSFFYTALRKPEFQRETLHWSPSKVSEMVESFLDARLIPAVILWRSGPLNFVVDGAHRLSALLAWIYDDYGDGKRSKQLFGQIIPPEQQELADKTRALIGSRIGKFEIFEAGREFPGAVSETQKSRISNLSVAHFVAQWVPAASKDDAEKAFFKINEAATPLDPTEKRIIQYRESASAISARAITHAGKGFAYWQHFGEPTKVDVPQIASRIYDLLYKPPLSSGPIDTLDVPVAGRGYSVLPFVFDLVNTVNQTKAQDSTHKKKAKKKDEALPRDEDGAVTFSYLKSVYRTVSRITGKEATSMGLHPVVYFYTKGGSFSPWSFLAWSAIINRTFETDGANRFCDIRERLENFLLANKWAMTEIIHKNGSGNRSTPWLEKFWSLAISELEGGLDVDGAQAAIAESAEFKFLKTASPHYRLPGENSSGRISKTTKTAAVWEAALPGAPRCPYCHGLWHRNSIHGDHITPRRDGGDGRPSNTALAHPYCDATYKDYTASRSQDEF